MEHSSNSPDGRSQALKEHGQKAPERRQMGRTAQQQRCQAQARTGSSGGRVWIWLFAAAAIPYSSRYKNHIINDN